MRQAADPAGSRDVGAEKGVEKGVERTPITAKEGEILYRMPPMVRGTALE